MKKALLFCILVLTMSMTSVWAQCPKLCNEETMVPLFGAALEEGDFEEGVWAFNAESVLVPNKDSVIWTKKKYGSFVCSFEFFAPAGSNSGFLFHCTDKGDWIPNTIEIQLLGDYGQQPDYHTCGSFYGYQAPSENATKPADQWNKMVVVSLAQTVDIYLNGKHVNHIDLSQWTDNAKSPAGTDIEEKFRGKALADAEPYGYIGFQGQHGGEGITFRNAKIKQITCNAKGADAELLFGEKLENAEYNPEVWSIDAEGVMSAKKDDVIWSKEKFENFVYDLEFKNSKDSNSGIVIYCSDKANWIPNSLEIQVYDSFEGPSDISACGAVYGHCAPLFNACKAAGEWNHMQIVCKGNLITVFLNDELVTRMDKSLWTEKDRNPDGTDVPAWLREHSPSELENSGYIGLQGLHGDSRVVYRNVRVIRLPNKK